MRAHELAAKLLALPDHEVHVRDDDLERLDPIVSVRVEWSDDDGDLPYPDWYFGDEPPPAGPRDRFVIPSVVIRGK